jgi:hypothetical protein
MKVPIIFISLFLTLFSACNKSKNNPVPNYSFDTTINIDFPSYSGLVGVGGWTYMNGGSRGVIIYRQSVDVFVAFDRHSPKDLHGDCPEPLTPDLNNFLQLNDSCSGATFSLYDGSVISGSEFGLRQYQTVWNGVNSLRVYN